MRGKALPRCPPPAGPVLIYGGVFSLADAAVSGFPAGGSPPHPSRAPGQARGG